MTPSWIEALTLPLVSQCLNQLRLPPPMPLISSWSPQCAKKRKARRSSSSLELYYESAWHENSLGHALKWRGFMWFFSVSLVNMGLDDGHFLPHSNRPNPALDANNFSHWNHSEICRDVTDNAEGSVTVKFAIRAENSDLLCRRPAVVSFPSIPYFFNLTFFYLSFLQRCKTQETSKVKIVVILYTDFLQVQDWSPGRTIGSPNRECSWLFAVFPGTILHIIPPYIFFSWRYNPPPPGGCILQPSIRL